MEFQNKFNTVASMVTSVLNGQVRQRTTQPKNVDICVETEETVGTAESQERLLFGKGNVSLPLRGEEEDWDILMSGISDEEGRQGMSKDSGSGGTEEPGEVFGKCQCAGLVLLRRVVMILKYLCVAESQTQSESMRALAARCP